MRTNRELRQEAKTAIRGRWTWRLLCVFFALQFIGQTVSQLLMRFNEDQGVISAGDFLQKKMAALQQGLDYALPTREAYRQMWIATGFEYFIATVFGAIALFGLTAIVLRALKNEEEGWFASGFGGFRRPLGVTVLLLVQNVVVGFWTLFFVVPGIVAAYRYRLVWYLKCENPDWGVLRCLGESVKMMKGYKWKAFVFDLAYYVWFLAVGMLAVAGGSAMGESFALNVVGTFVLAAAIVAAIHVLVCFVAGRAAFYRELKAEMWPEAQDDLPGND